jgi:hypothetical protein
MFFSNHAIQPVASNHENVLLVQRLLYELSDVSVSPRVCIRLDNQVVEAPVLHVSCYQKTGSYESLQLRVKCLNLCRVSPRTRY